MICHLRCTLPVLLPGHTSVRRLYRAFHSHNIDLLLRAYLTYVRPLIKHDSVIWSPYTVKDIELIESVQRRFTKRLPGFNIFPYAERLKRLDLPSLELQRLHADLIFVIR